MANTDRARKLLVRSALVTSSTIATLIGAQNLAMLDASQLTLTSTPVLETAIAVPLDQAATPVPIAHVSPNLIIQQAAPSIIILRQSVTQSGNPTGQSVVIQPPNPAQVAAPDPVIVQQPAPQFSAPNPVVVQQAVPQNSRSSR